MIDLNDLNTRYIRDKISSLVIKYKNEVFKPRTLQSPTVFDVLNKIRDSEELSSSEMLIAAYQLGYFDHYLYVNRCLNMDAKQKDIILLMGE